MVNLAGLFEGINAGIMQGSQLGFQFRQMKDNKETKELQKEQQKLQMQQLQQKVAQIKWEQDRVELQEKAAPVFYQYMAEKAAEQDAAMQGQSAMGGPAPGGPPPGVMAGPPAYSSAPAPPAYCSTGGSPYLRENTMGGGTGPPPPGVMSAPPAYQAQGAPYSQYGFLTGGPGNWGAEGTASFQTGPGLGGKAKPGLQPSDFANPLSPTGVDNPQTPATPQMLDYGREIANRPAGPGRPKGISGKDFAILLELADKSGNLNELQYYSQQGYLRTPNEILAQEAERIKNKDDSTKMDEFALKFEQAQLNMREQKFRQGMGEKWIKEGKYEAGVAALGGDFDKALKSAFKDTLGKDGVYKTKLDLVQGMINGDPRAAEAMDILIATEQVTGLTMTTTADGTTSVSTTGTPSVPTYPLKDFQKDQISLTRIKDSLKAIDQLDAIAEQYPLAIGATGLTQKIGSGVLGTLGELFPGATGEKLKAMSKNPNAEAAAVFESVGENLAMSYAADVWQNQVVTDDDKKGAATVLGISGGFSTLTGPEARTKLAVARERFLEGQRDIGGRRAAFEANAPRTAKARTSWDDKRDELLGRKAPAPASAAPAAPVAPAAKAPAATPLPAAKAPAATPAPPAKAPSATPPPAPAPAPAAVDPAAIKQRVDSMTPEQKQQRIQELLLKQQGG